MKKLIALVVALVLLAATAVACAESTAGTMSLTNLAVSAVTGERGRAVKLRGMSLWMALGSAEGVPTLQVSFDNGKGQVVDGVLQIVDTRLLMSVGGVSGTYYIDLCELAGDESRGELIAKGIGSALQLAGPHLDVLLYALTTENAKGVRTLEIDLPGDMYAAVAENALSIVEGLESAEDAEVDELMKQVKNMEGGATLALRYRPDKGTVELAALQDGRGIQLSANMALSLEEAIFVNISADELQYDLMHIDEAQLNELRGELDIIAHKFGQFSLGTGLGKLFK